MERVGIPVFESRVSPVLDSCNRLLVVDIDEGHEVNRVEISLEKINITERIEIFTRWGIRKIICAGVSDIMCRYLAAKRIMLISGIAGKLEDILNAYLCNKLDDVCFSMPGKGGGKGSSKNADRER
jgi:predicted Fe-Mo cluster-binding NifX family protein